MSYIAMRPRRQGWGLEVRGRLPVREVRQAAGQGVSRLRQGTDPQRAGQGVAALPAMQPQPTVRPQCLLTPTQAPCHSQGTFPSRQAAGMALGGHE